MTTLTEKSLQITLNGEAYSVKPNTHVVELLDMLGVQGKRIAVELNEEIVPKSTHATTLIKSGDRIEVVNAIGGG